MKCSAQRKCQHCKEFYLPDRRNLHHSATAQNLPVADRAKRKVSAAGYKNRTTKTTSAGRKIASASKSGANAIPGTGAKRSLHPKNRYKISARLKWLRMRKLKE